MMLSLKSGPQIAAKVGNPAGLLCRRIWYSVGKSGVLGITEYRQGRPLIFKIVKVSTYAKIWEIAVERSDLLNKQVLRYTLTYILLANYKTLCWKVAGKSVDRTRNDPCVNWLSGLNCMV